MKTRIHSLSSLAVACLAVSTSLTHATEVFRLEGYGPVSRAMGGTATAINVGAAGMMTNPATLSMMTPGSELHLGLDLITTDLSIKNEATGESVSSGTHGNNRGPYLAPEVAFTKQNGALTWGIGAFAQGGLGTEYGNASFLSRAAGGLNTGLENSSRLLVLNIPFAASYQVNDKLAVGGSIDAMWQGLNLDMLLGASQVGALIGAGRVSGSLLPVLGGLPDLRGAHFSLTKDEPLASGIESWGFGGRIGMTYKMSEGTVFGLDYAMQSRMNDMEGQAKLTAVDGIAGQIPLTGKLKLRNFQMPAKLDVGISHRLNPQWMMAVDVSQVFWEQAMKDLNVGFVADNGQTLDIQLPQNYKNQTILALGVAYQTGPWTLRGGARLASQALRSETLLSVIPATPTKHVSAGFSYAFSRESSLDLAYSHAFEESMGNASLPNTAGPIMTKHSQNSLTLGYTHRF